MKAAPKKKNQLLDDSDEKSEEDSGFDEEEKAIFKMLPADQRKMLAELEQAGASKSYIKKKI